MVDKKKVDSKNTKKVVYYVQEKPTKKKKKSVSRVGTQPVRARLSEEDSRTEKILIENFVALQRVMTHLSEKFDSLGTQLSKLLNLFEISAKALAEKEFDMEKENKDLKKAIEKLDILLEQNKTIAKGVVLLHDEIYPKKEMIAEREEKQPEGPTFFSSPNFNSSQSFNSPQNSSLIPAPIAPKNKPIPHETYQKSISSDNTDFSSEPPQLPPKFKPLPK